MNVSSLSPIGSCSRDTSVARIIAKELEAIGAFQVSPQTLELLTASQKSNFIERAKSFWIGPPILMQLSSSNPGRRRSPKIIMTTRAHGLSLKVISSYSRHPSEMGNFPQLLCMSDLEVIGIPLESLNACLAQEGRPAQTIERMLAAREAASGSGAHHTTVAADEEDRVRILGTLFEV